tara:strand:+ start:365 stop:688 length:324 start_codon:yes stop_codon:yes gene_type:complete
MKGKFMSNFTYKIKALKKNRDKQIRKLSKLLKLLVEAEWDMVTKSYEQNDRISLLASKSVADSSKYVQTAISQLILADFSEIEKSENKTVKTQNIQQLKKVVLGKNK